MYQKIEKFLKSNSAWMYLVLLLFISYLLQVTVVKSGWTNYFLIFGKLTIYYTPVLFFAFFRERLVARLAPYLLVLLWLFCFVGFPLLLFSQQATLVQYLIPITEYNFAEFTLTKEFPYSFLLTISTAILFTEIAILIHEYAWQKWQRKNWFEQGNIEKMILGTGGIMTLLLAAKGVASLLQNGHATDLQGIVFLGLNFIAFTVQYLLIMLVYYFYYYINKRILIPKFLKEEGILAYGFSVTAVILLFYPVFIFLIRYLPMVETLQLTNYTTNMSLFASDGGAGVFFLMFLSVPIIISNQWYQQANQIANLKKEKTTTELHFLKQQINPHFFFNTLNNLYSLSITKDKQTPEVILQLSELMRYVIYKGKEDQVTLEEEIKYIEDYIQLQQIRLHKQLDFKFEKIITEQAYLIPPLLLITFVENAFKHGIETAEKEAYLHLFLKCDADGLTFSCKNSFEGKISSPPGIGLKNLKRRLELRFPKRHQIETMAAKNNFSAFLTIK